MVQPQMGVACVGVTKTDVMDLMNVNPQFLPQIMMSLHLRGINLIEKMFQIIVIGSGEISILPDPSVNTKYFSLDQKVLH